jgi:hypothetical protein
MLLVLAPLASLSLAGQEHGRTIPLADIDKVQEFCAKHGPVHIAPQPAAAHCRPAQRVLSLFTEIPSERANPVRAAKTRLLRTFGAVLGAFVQQAIA